MVDSQASLQQVYSKWESRNPWNFAGKSTSSNYKSYQSSIDNGKEAWKKRFGNIGPPPNRRLRNSRVKTSYNNVPLASISYSTLSQFKVFPSIMPSLGRIRPFMGRCCSCMPSSKNEFYEEQLKDSGIQNILFIESSTRDLISRNFKKLAFILRLRFNHRYPDVSISVLTSPRLVNEVMKLAQAEEGDNGMNLKLLAKKKKDLHKMVKNKLSVMQAAISNSLLRLTAWVLHHVLSWFLDSILVHKGQMAMVKKASKRNIPVIYLPTHRSHLDYILITFILVNSDLQAPYVAAGDNLRIPVFGYLLRGLGGYFIRRKLDRGGKKDTVYRALLHSYMEELLRANEHMEFFIEGGRTRSGKALYPKAGLLSVIVDCYNEGVFPDALLVPVSISYDKLLDGNFNTEQMGEAKVFETFLGTVRAIWRVLKSQYGNVRIDFAQPFSLKEYLQVAQGYHSNSSHSSDSISPVSDNSQENLSHGKLLRRRGSDHSFYGTDIVVDGMRTTIQGLAEHVVYDQIQCQAVMSTQLLSFLLLVKHRQGASYCTVISSFDWLKKEIVHRKHDLGFIGNTADVVDHARCMLGNLVQVQQQSSHDGSSETYLLPSIDLPSVFQLSYYGNMVASVFAAESIMATAIYSLVDTEKWVNQGYDNVIHLSREQIIETSAMLCKMFKYDFILKPPCQQYDLLLTECMEEFLTSEILAIEEEDSYYRDSSERAWSSRLAKSLSCMDEDSDDDIVCDTYYVLNKESEISMEKFWFMKAVLGPFIECYFITACNLVKLQTNDWPEQDFVKYVHNCLKERAYTGIAQYCESASLDTLKNALRSFEEQHVIDIYHGPDGVKMTGLSKKYRHEDKLNQFIVLLESCRS